MSMIALNNTVRDLINSITDLCIEIIKSPQFEDKIIDIKIVNNKRLEATSFQIGMLYENLKSVSPYYYKVDCLNEALSLLKKKLHKRYEQNGFNYFHNHYLPDDLDTAAVITRVLDDSKVTNNYLNFVKVNSTVDGFISTWSKTNNNKNNKDWASGEYSFHIDVMLNHFLTQLMINKNDNLIASSLRKMVKKFGLANYWYIPFLYSTFIYSKILVIANYLFTLEDVEKINEYLLLYKTPEQIKNKYRFFNNCRYNKVQELIYKDNVRNWLDLTFYIGSLCNIRIFLNSRSKIIDDIIIRELDSILKDRNKYTPSLHWSLKFIPYKSRLLNDSIFLEILTRIIQYLVLEEENDLFNN